MSRASAFERKSTSGRLVAAAVKQAKPLSRAGLSERAFSLAFSGLVYPQIWEDPDVDIEALQINDQTRMIAIASGGCNVMSYLAHGPMHITAVDLNTAHVALNRLKLCAARHLPDYQAFRRFFAEADCQDNVRLFDRVLSPQLDCETLQYWNGRTSLGRRRIERFRHNFYRYGLLGKFIGAGHVLARMLGADPRRFLRATSLADQRRIYKEEFAPLFRHPLVGWMIRRPSSLFGLGIPPAQYQALAKDHSDGIAGALRERLERLATAFPIEENYFAWQAFGRGYQRGPNAALPPYLQEKNFRQLKAHAERAEIRHASLIDVLAQSPDTSLDRYVLLDAQDWMTDEVLNRLWIEISRTARPGARVIFRTAAAPTLLPGRIADEILSRWRYEAALSRALHEKDRSAIYGGFHLYVLRTGS